MPMSTDAVQAFDKLSVDANKEAERLKLGPKSWAQPIHVSPSQMCALISDLNRRINDIERERASEVAGRMVVLPKIGRSMVEYLAGVIAENQGRPTQAKAVTEALAARVFAMIDEYARTASAAADGAKARNEADWEKEERAKAEAASAIKARLEGLFR